MRILSVGTRFCVCVKVLMKDSGRRRIMVTLLLILRTRMCESITVLNGRGAIVLLLSRSLNILR